MSFSPEWASVVIAGVSFVLSVALGVFYLRDRRRTAFTIERDYTNELLGWHADVVGILASLRLETPPDAERGARLARLSSLIEQGRFFFPNIDLRDGFGSEKPPAYQGYRNLALDFLVASYNIFSGPITPKSTAQAEVLQRHFTSIVFEVVRPQDRLDRIRSFTDRYFVQEKCFQDFLDHPDGAAISAIWRRPGDA